LARNEPVVVSALALAKAVDDCEERVEIVGAAVEAREGKRA
jgi:hypothetical protein